MKWMIAAGALTIVASRLALAPSAYACAIAGPFPTTEERVTSATAIYTATVTARFLDPPLDPSVPDDLIHVQKVTVTVDEYLKGSGETDITYATTTTYFFENGTLLSSSNDCDPWGQEPPIGLPILVFLENGPPGYLDVIQLNQPGAEQFVQDIRNILNATPTPVPTQTQEPPSLSASPPIPSQTVQPASFPPTGGMTHDSAMPQLILAGITGMTVSAALIVGVRRL